MPSLSDDSVEAIAIVGMTGRFPGASNLEQFWRNLCDGVESISFFSEAELRAAGVDPALFTHPNYVPAAGVLDAIDGFDAAFFGFNPREAEIIDPQQRLFLECAWEALEHANCDPDTYPGRIGVYAGASMSSYYLNNLYPNKAIILAVGTHQTLIGNDKDFLATRVSYKCNLRGPSFTVQTACSTSLVATHLACQALLNYQCDVALAGGATIRVPQQAGYLYQEGSIVASDGHCRAFDAQAQGTIGSSGIGVVVLKRLEDALADRDPIYAVIRGSAINNDGLLKIGYTAPSIDGQTEVIREALELAGVAAESVGYVEAHGTATPLGDPIEVAALTRAFRATTAKQRFCALGSVKTNIGHLDSAAGVAGLIKAVLALQHRQIPPSLHFHSPNPKIDFDSSPFFVNTALAEWPSNGSSRRAGVSSFGIGGTNVHMILEEAPEPAPSGPGRPWQLLTLSAKTRTALATTSHNLAQHLRALPELALADAAYTLQVGRKAFAYRYALVCSDHEDAIALLEGSIPERVLASYQEFTARPVAFLFPGQGAQYVGMGRGLYEHEPVFREQVDHCAELLRPHLGLDLREMLYGTKDERPKTKDDPSDSSFVLRPSSELLDQTQYAQPALFVIEYALAQLWMSWGIVPQTMIGHSIGEYVAACLAGVFSLEDALALVATRGRLMQSLPPGTMLSIALPEEQVQGLLGDGLALAAVNAPASCVVAGRPEAIDQLVRHLEEQGVESRRLHTSHAFHSAMMDPIMEPFEQAVRAIPLNPPQIEYISNVTGASITAAQATDPAYWAIHLRQTVRFAAGLGELLRNSDCALLEIGPGQSLMILAKQTASRPDQIVIASMRHPRSPTPDLAFLLTSLGQLWLAGVQPGWEALYAHEQRRRVALPTYPFEHQRFWIDPPEVAPYATTHPARSTGDATSPDDAARPTDGAEFNLHPRPAVANLFIAPRNDIEQTIVEIWQLLLGIEQVGVADSFFDLGGHSLLVMQLASRLRDTFEVELPIQIVFETPTVAGMAQAIIRVRAEQQDRGEVERLLAELDDLSEEEVEQLLSQDG